MTDKDEGLERYRRLPVASLYVPRDYQRTFKPQWVESRVSRFDEKRLGTLVVSASGNGRYAVIDGQHRLGLLREAAAQGVPGVPTHVWCEVRLEPSRESEADLFLGRNDAQPVHPIDKFRARVVAMDPTANAIKDILKKYSVQIGFPTSSQDSFNYGCVNAIENAYATGQLDEIMRIIEESWGRTFGKLARTQLSVDGVTLFHNTYRAFSEYSVDRAISEFSKVEKFSILVSQAKNNATANGTQTKYQFALLLLPRYNRGLKNRLPVNNLIEAY